MDNKRPKDTDDLRGFEEFIQHASLQPGQSMEKNQKNAGAENITFLTHDYERLRRVAELLAKKLPVARSHDQGNKLVEAQEMQNQKLKTEINALLEAPDSPLSKSMAMIFDGYFKRSS